MRKQAVSKDTRRQDGMHLGMHLAALLFNSALRTMARQAIGGMRNSLRPTEYQYVFVDSGPIQQKRREHQILTYICGKNDPMVKESQSKLDTLEEDADKELRKARIGPRRRLLLKTLIELSYVPDLTSPDMEIDPVYLFEVLTKRKINRDIAKALKSAGFEWWHVVKRLA